MNMGWKAGLHIFLRRIRLFVAVVGGVGLLAVVYLLVAPKKYEVEVRLLYKENPTLSPIAALTQEGVGGAMGGLGALLGMGSNLDNKIALLSGLELFVSVTKKLPSEDLRALTRPNPLTIPLRWVKRLFFPRGPARPPYLKAAIRLQRKVDIEPVGASTILRIVYRDTDRERVERIAQLLMEEAQRLDARTRSAYYLRAARSLEKEYKEVKDSLSRVRSTFEAFQKSTRLVALEPQMEALATSLAQLQDYRAQAEAYWASIQALSKGMDTTQEELLHRLPEEAFQSIPQMRVLWDSLVSLQVEYLQLKVEGMDTTNARMIDLLTRIRRLQDQLQQRIVVVERERFWGDPARYLDSLNVKRLENRFEALRVRARLEALKRLEVNYEKRLQDLPPDILEYMDLRQKYAYYTAMNLALQSQIEQFQALARYPVSSLYPVQGVYPPGDPVSPRPLLVLVLSVFLGLLMGVVAVVGMELMDPRVHVAENLISFGPPVLIEASGTSPVSFDPLVSRILEWREGYPSSKPWMLALTGTFPSKWVSMLLKALYGVLNEVDSDIMWFLPEDLGMEWSSESMHLQFYSRESLQPILVARRNGPVVVVHPLLDETREDDVLRALLIRSDGVVLGVTDHMSQGRLSRWIVLAQTAKTDLLGWMFVRTDRTG